MNVILRIEMMDAFGVDSAFEGRHRAMMAHTPVSKAATMDSSVLTKAAKSLGVPAPSNCLMRRLRLKAPTWISRRLRMLPRPRKCRRRIAPVSYTWAKDRSTSSARRFCNRWPRDVVISTAQGIPRSSRLGEILQKSVNMHEGLVGMKHRIRVF